MMVIRINQWSSAWHVGEPFPVGKELGTTLNDERGMNPTFCVQADGEELEHVLYLFGYIPHTRAPVQIWHGEFARFIIANLALKFTS